LKNNKDFSGGEQGKRGQIFLLAPGAKRTGPVETFRQARQNATVVGLLFGVMIRFAVFFGDIHLMATSATLNGPVHLKKEKTNNLAEQSSGIRLALPEIMIYVLVNLTGRE